MTCVDRNGADAVTDTVFLIIFLVDFIVVLSVAVRSLKRNEQMVNRANVLIVSFLLLTLVNRMVCLLYSLVLDCNKDIPRNTVQMWFYFELPIAFINAASIVLFFEWAQFAQFLRASQ
jgi:hypothetical protein